jgi:hypothetical protein
MTRQETIEVFASATRKRSLPRPALPRLSHSVDLTRLLIFTNVARAFSNEARARCSISNSSPVGDLPAVRLSVIADDVLVSSSSAASYLVFASRHSSSVDRGFFLRSKNRALDEVANVVRRFHAGRNGRMLRSARPTYEAPQRHTTGSRLCLSPLIVRWTESQSASARLHVMIGVLSAPRVCPQASLARRRRTRKRAA